MKIRFFTCCSDSFFLPVLLIALLLSVAGCGVESAEADWPEYSIRYDPARNPFADGRSAIKLATSSNRRILIEVGGEWCGWCRALDQLKRHADIRRQLRKFVVLKVNVSDANENEAFLSSLPKLRGYPQLYISEKDGTILHAQDVSTFVVDGRYSRDRYLEFLRQWTHS